MSSTSRTRRNRPTTRHPTIAGVRRDLIDAVAAILAQARSALFITGPGLTIESGLPHYRGIPGLERQRPGDDRRYEAAMSAESMQQTPAATWKCLLQMERNLLAAAPNRGHEVLVKLERQLERATIMTINVDRLHQRAGSRDVIEMHGALFDLLCPKCELSTRHESFDELDIPPRCTTCGAVLRPDMALFGESLPQDPFTRLQAELDEGFDAVISIGVATMFPYIARPLLVARSEGIPTVEIGTQQTEVSDVVELRLKGSPMAVLDAIWDAYKQQPRRS